MSDAVAALRARALSRMLQDHPIHLILDDDLRDELATARRSVDILQARRDQMEADGNLGPVAPASLADTPTSPVADIDRMLQAARDIVESVETEAIDAGAVLVLHFRQLPEAQYQAEVDAAELATQDPARFLAVLGDALLGLSYLSASTADGQPLGLTLDELRANTLNHADVAQLREHVIRINRSGQAVPFSQRNSGRPPTN